MGVANGRGVAMCDPISCKMHCIYHTHMELIDICFLPPVIYQAMSFGENKTHVPICNGSGCGLISHMTYPREDESSSLEPRASNTMSSLDSRCPA